MIRCVKIEEKAEIIKTLLSVFPHHMRKIFRFFFCALILVLHDKLVDVRAHAISFSKQLNKTLAHVLKLEDIGT